MKKNVLIGILLVILIGGGIIFGVTQMNKSSDNNSGTITLGKNSLSSEVKKGDYVAYNAGTENSYTSTMEKNGAGNQTFETTGKEIWRVLSVDEDGTVNLVSENPIEDNQSNDLKFSGGIGYINFINELNNVCAIYGKGKNAVSARSMTYEDIIKTIGYDAFESAYGITLTGTEDEKVKTIMETIGKDKKIAGLGRNDSYGQSFTVVKQEYQRMPSDQNDNGYVDGGVQTYTDNYLPSLKLSRDVSKDKDALGLALGYMDSFWIANSAIHLDYFDNGVRTDENVFASYYIYMAYFGGDDFDNTYIQGINIFNGSPKLHGKNEDNAIRPVVSLDKNTKTSGGTGTKDDPFKI